MPAKGDVSLSNPIRRLDPDATRIAVQGLEVGILGMRGTLAGQWPARKVPNLAGSGSVANHGCTCEFFGNVMGTITVQVGVQPLAIGPLKNVMARVGPEKW
jgi:hypothetical protein